MTTLTETIREKIQSMREERGVVTIDLNGCPDNVIAAIEGAGGRKVRDGYNRWCNSDTCNHFSHDPGQEYTTVEVPQSWREEVRAAQGIFEVWDIEDEDTLLLIIPSDPPVAVTERQRERAFAAYTYLAELLPIAKEALLQSGS